MTATVLLLESAHARAASFAPALEKRGYTVIREHTLQAALNHARSGEPNLIIVDAASFKTSGMRLCQKLRAVLNSTPILLIVPLRAAQAPDSGDGASITLISPVTPRKLLNRVAHLLPAKEDSAYLQAGPIKLYLAQRRVICRGKQAYLTPKLTRLLEMFLRAPGQLITRRAIIKHVWQTDYIGDSRMLDVHISWLRRVIEPNPGKPRCLKTVRGQGYRLDVG